MKKKSTDLGGFTIIEVVLVLAIAGLIFLMVFIALPALQRAQRDTQRRDDMARVSEAITQYQTNNNGKLPEDGHGIAMVDGSRPADEALPACNSSTNSPEACFITNYMNAVDAAEAGGSGNTFTDPDGTYYGLQFSTLGTGARETLDNSKFNEHKIYVWKHGKCDGEAAIYSSNARDYAVMYKLEGSGTYCQDNQ